MNKKNIAIVSCAKNEDRTIQEWINYHIKLGIDRIFIYQNDWTCNLQHHKLTKLRCDGKNIQPKAINDWIESRYSYEFDYAAFIDCDEFIVLHKHKNISDFLSEFNPVIGISINWCMFGSGGQLTPYPNPESLIKRFTYRNKNSNTHVKTILNLKSKCSMATTHVPNKPTIDTNLKTIIAPYNPNGPIDVAQINHYLFKSKQEWNERIYRGVAGSTFRPIDQWDKTTNQDHHIKDLTALNFLYDTNSNIKLL